MKKVIVGNLVKFTFDDNVPAYTFDCTKMSGATRDYAIQFGMCHRLGNAAALSRTVKVNGVETVRTITEAMRREAIVELGTHYESGSADWNIRGSGRAPALFPLWEAMAAKRGVEYSVIEAEQMAKMQAELDAME